MNEFWGWAGSIPWYAWIAIVAILGVCAIVVLSLRHARVKRELLHAERIRAIEAGLPWQEPESAPKVAPQVSEKHKSPGAKFMHNAYWISFWVVVTVPGVAFSAASAVTTEFHIAIGIAAWGAAALASVAAVVCVTTLMIYSRSCQEPRDSYSAKPRKPT